MKARLLLRERYTVGEDAFAEMVIWQLPRSLPGSAHTFKYRLAFVVDLEFVLRFDNEAGQGDHKHIRERRVAYGFTSLEQLASDFWNEVEAWRARRTR